jgi:hypothetical protein
MGLPIRSITSQIKGDKNTHRSLTRKLPTEQAAMVSRFAATTPMPNAPTNHRMSSKLPRIDIAPLLRWKRPKRVAASGKHEMLRSLQ